MVASTNRSEERRVGQEWPLGGGVGDKQPTLEVTEAVACRGAPVLEVKVTVHWPLVLVPVVALVFVMWVRDTPFLSVWISVVCSSVLGCRPLPAPLSAFTVTVKV